MYVWKERCWFEKLRLFLFWLMKKLCTRFSGRFNTKQQLLYSLLEIKCLESVDEEDCSVL